MRYVALLRGINSGSDKLINMGDLKALMKNFNFANVATVLNNGNVIFDNIVYPSNTLVRVIKGAIMDFFEYDIPVMIKNEVSLRKIIQNNPFLKEEGINKDHLYLTFLDDIPPPHKINLLSYIKTKDRYAVVENCVYLHIKGPFYKTKLSNRNIERELDILSTTRSWNTVEKLLELTTVEAKKE